jgi:hypothetical protein
VSLAPQRVEALGDRARRLALAAATFAEHTQLGFDDREPTPRVIDELLGEILFALEIEAHRFGLGPFDEISRQALLDLGQAIAEELAPIFEPRGAHFDVGADRADCRCAFLEAAAGVGHGAASVEELGLLGLEGGQGRNQLGDAGGIAIDALGEIGEACAE